MKIRNSFSLAGSLLCFLIVNAAECSAQSGVPSAPAPAVMRSQVRVTQLKPDLVNEWLSIQKNEVNPALKKAGISSRAVVENVYGNMFEYLSITPIENYSVLDGDDPLVRALGKDAGARLRARLARCIVSQYVFITSRLNDLSSVPDPKTPPLVWVTSRYRVAAGKAQAYEDFLKTDIVPAYAKAKAAGKMAGYSVNRRGLGASSRDVTTVVYLNKFADLEAGSPLTQILGREGVAKLTAKSAPLSALVETVVRRRVADLSY